MSMTTIPAHIPPELVTDVAIESIPGGDKDPFKAMSSLHEGPDIIWSPRARRGGPSWIITRHELIREVLQDSETFSSKGTAGFSALLGEDWDLIPLELDGLEHSKFRVLLNPIFSPKKIDLLGDSVEGTASSLVDDILARGECEFVDEFARPFPVAVFLKLFGLPVDEMPRFLKWEDSLLHDSDIEEKQEAARDIKNYLLGMAKKRRAEPEDDLISFAVTSQVDGRPLTDDEVLGLCFLLFVGGLDTVASSLGFFFMHLAKDQEHQRLLREKPELIPDAIEEILRAHAIVTTVRRLTKDISFHGVELKKGESVVLPMALSSRDEREYECPHKIDFEREAYSHITFSSGPHRCVGSHLARRELKIALELWLTRIPQFKIKPGETPVTHTSAVLGVDYLPLVWD